MKSLMMKIQPVCGCSDPDRESVAEVLNWEFIQLILVCFLAACTTKTKLRSEVHVSRTHKSSLLSKVQS